MGACSARIHACMSISRAGQDWGPAGRDTPSAALLEKPQQHGANHRGGLVGNIQLADGIPDMEIHFPNIIYSDVTLNWHENIILCFSLSKVGILYILSISTFSLTNFSSLSNSFNLYSS